MFKKLLLSLVLLVGSIVPAVASDFYVSSATGNDANPGTQAQPWATFAKAVSGFTLTSGTTTVHFAGTISSPQTYLVAPTSTCAGANHTPFCVTRGGTASTPVVFQCDQGLNGNAGHPGAPGPCQFRSSSNTTNQQFVGIQNTNNFSLLGFDIGGDATHPATTFSSGVLIYGKETPTPNGNFVHIDHNYVHDLASTAPADQPGFNVGCPSEGMIVGDFNNSTNPQKLPIGGSVIGNWINNGGNINDPACNQFHGTYINGPQWTIASNLIGNVPGAAIKLYPNVCDEFVSNNLVYHAGWWGILVASSNTGCPLTGFTTGFTTVNNNIGINNGFNHACGAIAEGTGSGTNAYNNNLLLGNAPSDNVVQNCSTNTSVAGVSGTINGSSGATIANTLTNYQNDGTGNYKPIAGSKAINGGSTACVNGGLNPCVPAAYFDGTPLTFPPNIGPYPTTAAVGPPNPPTNVQIVVH